MSTPAFLPYRPRRLSQVQMLRRARRFHARMNERRSVRHFAPDPVPRELIALAIAAASTAPSGAHRQPWRFVAVNAPDLKRQIRQEAEAKEREFYTGGRAPREWLDALAPLGTSWEKPYLEIAPWLVIVFALSHCLDAAGGRRRNYYVKESVGIACGLFIAAIHDMGLATLPHTPQPMQFLSQLLNRPRNEKPFALFPVGYPATDCLVPNLCRKALAQVAVWHVAAEAHRGSPERGAPETRRLSG